MGCGRNGEWDVFLQDGSDGSGREEVCANEEDGVVEIDVHQSGAKRRVRSGETKEKKDVRRETRDVYVVAGADCTNFPGFISENRR